LAIRPFGTMITLFLIGASSGGCSFSRFDGGFGGFFSKGEDSEVVTGSITEPVPTESDLAFARTAASDVLTKGDKDTSQPWQNPETGIFWQAMSTAAPKAGCRARPARLAMADGKFIR
jgi:17 kDa outer membrane surface antigen